MSDYRAPIEDMAFIIDEVLAVESVLGSLPRFEELGVGVDLTPALLDEAGKLAGEHGWNRTAFGARNIFSIGPQQRRVLAYGSVL